MAYLSVLDDGSLEIALDALLPGEGGDEWRTIGVPGYLIQSDDGKIILVDTGLPPAYIQDSVGTARRDGYDTWMRSRATAEQRPAAQLARCGLSPADVTHLVITHTHFDHAGGLGEFPNAVHVIQRAERELPTPVNAGLSWPENVRGEFVEGDVELAPRVQLLATPGHSPGHMSVLLSLANNGPVLLAIDAIYLPQALERDNFKASWNEALARQSGRRVAQLAREAGAWLIYGHDPAQWATLRKAPARYD